MQLTRLFALLVCFASGASVPLVTMAEEQGTATVVAATFHTSSRNQVYQVDVTDKELQVLRERLWALTAPGGTIHCHEAGINAPCANTISFEQTQ